MADLNESLRQLLKELLTDVSPQAMQRADAAWLRTSFSALVPDSQLWAKFVAVLSQRLGTSAGSSPLDLILGSVYQQGTPAALIEYLLNGDMQAGTPRIPSFAAPPQTDLPKAAVAPPPPSASPNSPLEKHEPNFSVVRVFYATDRAPTPDASLGIKFDTGRQHEGPLNFGECEVSLPACHQVGHLESPSLLRLEFHPDPDRHIVLNRVSSLEEEEFLARVQSSVAASPAREAFVFVHGYNVKFKDAARRTGQFAFDLSFAGAPIFYSWPANGHTLDYSADEASVIWTAPHFERFLSLLTEHSGAQKIHLIAHSMGNRAVCEALRSLSLQRPATPGFLLHQLVLAAPDIDTDTFREMASALKTMSGHITLYASSRDKAIQLSRKLHDNPRAGAPPLVIAAGMDSVDASKVDTDFLAHSYFSNTWALLSDIHQLLESDTPAAKRFGLRAATGPDGVYFAFR